MTAELPTWEQIDAMVEGDPLKLRDLAWTLRSQLAENQQPTLRRLHDKVREQMADSAQAERDAAQEGRDSDAANNAAQVDALDWVLQRIDEELGS